MRVIITEDQVVDWVAVYVAKKIREFNPKKQRPFVLGLPTGETPLGMYKRLIQFYQDGLLSFKNVVTFNMDEYVGLEAENEKSYHYYMYHNFFNHIDIPKENINILDGMAVDYKKECEIYEEKIKAVGGIHLFLGGVGEDGHIAFNEPGSSLKSRTRDKELTTDTILANARFFGNDISKVPKLALTVGVGTILDADEVLIMVNGSRKAKSLHRGVEEGVNHLCTISALQLHEKGIIVADEAACSELMVGTYRYYKDIEKDNLNSKQIIEDFYREYR